MVADSAEVAKKALTIAIRYAAVRRQFKSGDAEVSASPILKEARSDHSRDTRGPPSSKRSCSTTRPTSAACFRCWRRPSRWASPRTRSRPCTKR